MWRIYCGLYSTTTIGSWVRWRCPLIAASTARCQDHYKNASIPAWPAAAVIQTWPPHEDWKPHKSLLDGRPCIYKSKRLCFSTSAITSKKASSLQCSNNYHCHLNRPHQDPPPFSNALDDEITLVRNPDIGERMNWKTECQHYLWAKKQ